MFQIVGCAIEVLNTLGHGLIEKPYENALVVEFGLRTVAGENWSVRVGDHYRAMGRFVEGVFIWEWIGTHGEYNRLA